MKLLDRQEDVLRALYEAHEDGPAPFIARRVGADVVIEHPKLEGLEFPASDFEELVLCGAVRVRGWGRNGIEFVLTPEGLSAAATFATKHKEKAFCRSGRRRSVVLALGVIALACFVLGWDALTAQELAARVLGALVALVGIVPLAGAYALAKSRDWAARPQSSVGSSALPSGSCS